MRELSGATLGQADQAITGRIRPQMFLEAWFATGPLRLCLGRRDLEWNGSTWYGGQRGVSKDRPCVLELAAQTESTQVEALGVSARLSGAPLTIPGVDRPFVQLVQDEIRQGKPCKMWFGYLDAAGAVIADPARTFAGRIDAGAVEASGSGIVVTLTAENDLIDLQRALGLGLGIAAGDIDEASVIFAANVCDELVGKAAGGTEPRYTCNGVFDASVPPGQVLEEMARAMAGSIFQVGGNWTFVPGSWRAPAVDFTIDDFRGGVQFSLLESRRDMFNAVRGRFVDPNRNWVETDYPPYASADLAATDGDTIWQEVDQAFCVSPSECQRKAKVHALLQRGRTCTLPLGLRALQVQPGDVVTATHAELGWEKKRFRVLRWELAFEQDEEGYYVCGVTLQAREETAEVYAWDPATEETAISSPAAITLPSAAPPAIVSPSGDPTVRPTIHPASWLSSNAGVLTDAASTVASGLTIAGTGWTIVSTIDFDVPAGASSFMFTATPGTTGAGTSDLELVGDNIGVAINDPADSAPASPQASRNGTGALTVPVTGTQIGLARKLRLYVKGKAGAVRATASLTQDLKTPLVSTAVA